MLSNCGMDCYNYSQTLNGWSSNTLTPHNLSLDADSLYFGTNAVAARNNLISTKGWTINNDLANPTACLEFDMSDYFITKWSLPVNQSFIRFNATTTGDVDYYWETISSGLTGFGTFTSSSPVTLSGLPAGDSIRLIISPTNLKHFNFNNGSDRSLILDVEQWGVVNWNSMLNMFYGCDHLQITASDAPNLSNVSSMENMFRSAINFNSPLNHWDISAVSDLTRLFYYAYDFNQPLNNWNTSNVTNMNQTFSDASSFNNLIGTWNTSNVTDMSYMFKNAITFNQPIGQWNTGSVTTMEGMFNSAYAFNQNIESWDVSNVIEMFAMFAVATSFNQPLNNWNVGNVSSMFSMFSSAESFNQPLDAWNTQNVTSMRQMFLSAYSFNQSIGNFDLRNIEPISGLVSLFNNTAIDCQNYSETIIGWSTNPSTPSNLSINSVDKTYGTNAVFARDNLISNKGWIINGDIASGVDCSPSAFLAEETKNLISISPNPTNGILQIELVKPTTISIITINGIEIITKTVSNFSIWDLTDLESGVYFVRSSEGQVVKIIKE
jgi:surface protein